MRLYSLLLLFGPSFHFSPMHRTSRIRTRTRTWYCQSLSIRVVPQLSVLWCLMLYLWIQDFLVISLMPPNPRSSFLIPLQFTHPIRLVTDLWVDEGVLHPSDTLKYFRAVPIKYYFWLAESRFGTDAEIYLWIGRC